MQANLKQSWIMFIREAAKKSTFFTGPTTKRGGGKGPASKEKGT